MSISKPAAASPLRFSQPKRWKQVRMYSIEKPLLLAHLQLLPPRYDFYERKRKTGTCNYRSQVHPALHILGGKQVPATGQVPGTRHALYFGWVNRYLRPSRSPIVTRCASCFGWVDKYLQPARSQVCIVHTYTLRFMFWVGKQVHRTGHVSSTSCASGFG